MNLKDKIDTIFSRLSILSTEVKLRDSLNMLDINVLSEQLYCDIFNILYGWKLENANVGKQNIKAIDLKDNNTKIIVQVSSDNSRKKVQDSLNKLDRIEYKGYTFKFISIAKNVDHLKKHSFTVPVGISFNPSTDCYDINNIVRDAQTKDIDTIVNLATYLEKSISPSIKQNYRSSVITYVINCLANENLSEISESPNIKPFDVGPKINKNSLTSWKIIIEELGLYSLAVDKIYVQYDKQGANKSFVVLTALHNKYLSLREQYNGDELFNKLLKDVYNAVDGDETCSESLTREELELNIKIVLVDAFMKCKIFEKPE